MKATNSKTPKAPQVFEPQDDASTDAVRAARANLAQDAATRLCTTVTVGDDGVPRDEDGREIDVVAIWPSTIEKCDTELSYWKEPFRAPSAAALASMSRTLQAIEVMAKLIGAAASETQFEPRNLVLAAHEVTALAGGIAELADMAEKRLADDTHPRDGSPDEESS